MTEATTSLYLSLKLKEAGAPQSEGHWRWYRKLEPLGSEHYVSCILSATQGPKVARAFTVGEMLQELYGLVYGVQLEFAGVGADRYVRVAFDLEQPFSAQRVDDDKDYDETFYEGKTHSADLVAAAVGDAYYWALKHKAATPPTA